MSALQSRFNAAVLPHPRTLLGAARMMTLAYPQDDVQCLHLKAQAACRLGYHQKARELWEQLACDDDADALYQLGLLAELGLGEDRDTVRAQAFFLRAMQIGHAAAMYRLTPQD